MQPIATAAADLGSIIKKGRFGRFRRIVTRILVILVAVAAVAGIVRWWRNRGAAPVPQYQTETLARGSLTVTVTATGTLEARNVVAVGSEVSGRVRHILVKDNDRVTKGQPLAQIDPEVLSGQLEQARAVRDQASAQVRQARATQHETALIRTRDKELHARGVVSEQELENAEAAAERAEAAVALAAANLRQATANVQVASTNLTKTEIRSPIDGIVLSHTVEEGQTVVAAFQTPVLFQIAEDLRELKLSVDVDEADIGKVREGQHATFTVAAYADRRFEARVTTVHNASQVVEKVVSYEAELAVDNKDLLLRPGMTATSQIIIEQVHDEMLVASQALRFTPPNMKAPPGTHVWVLRGGVPLAVPVKVLGESETQAAIRTRYAGEGELVMTNTR
ncbi:MAG TPA: efflux RND transporter periplasmic adaptor subunit [Kofleriaceae bacterium]|nr:efflux RND transporter periplasmic adaptor subunit [Kofleriaceae bacterium]